MSTFVRSNVKFLNLARLRFVQNAHSIYSKNLHLMCFRSGVQDFKSLRYFTSVAPKIKPLTEARNENSDPHVETRSSPSNIDSELSDVNFVVKRTGRTVLDRINSIFQVVENQGFATQTQSLYLLRCCGLLRLEYPAKRVELANKMWNKLQSFGIQFDVRHYNALLKVYLESNHNFKPSDILVSMEQNNVSPNQTTYLYLMEKFCNEGDLNGANEILECIKEKGIAVNETVFNSLIKGHIKINDESGARQIMEIMKSSKIFPSAKTYMTLACGFAEKGDIAKVDEILSEAAENAVFLDNENYLQIILALPSTKYSDYADRLLKKMNVEEIWRQEFINTSVELIYKNMDNVAYKLALRSTSTESYTGLNIFIKQIIKTNRPLETIIYYCEKIASDTPYTYMFTNAAKAAMMYQKYDLALDLFMENHKRGVPVRVHNFRDFFEVQQSAESAWKYLRCMSQIGVPVDFYTYLEYILPTISPKDPQATISKIQECGHDQTSVTDALFHYYCINDDIENASYMMQNYDVHVNQNFQLEHFLSLYENYKQSPSDYFKVLKHIMEDKKFAGSHPEVSQGKKLALFLISNPKLFDEFHKFSVGAEINYSPGTVDVCRNIVRRKDPSLLPHLRLISTEKTNNKAIRNISIAEEENILNSDKSDTQARKAQLMELVYLHLKNKDVDRLRKVKAELDSMNYIFPPTALTQAFFLHCEMNNLEEAAEALKTIKSEFPTFKVDTAKLFDYARLLLKFSKFDEVINVLKNEIKEINNFTGEDTLIRSMRRFLNNIVQTGDVELAKSAQNALKIHCTHANLKEVILEPVIKLHIYKKDLDNVLKEYESIIKEFKCLPSFNLVLKTFIMSNDQGKLQALIDMASKCEGNNRILHKLAVAFIELSHMQQAKNVIQRLGRNIDFIYFAEIGLDYYNQNKPQDLENLLYVTAGFNHDSRKVLYNHLFKIYYKKNDVEKAGQILDFLKNEKSELMDESKSLLNELFRKNGQSLPFPEQKSTSHDNINANEPVNEDVAGFLHSIKFEFDDQGLKHLDRMKKSQIRSLQFSDLTNFVDLLISKNSLTSLESNVHAMSYIIENSSHVIKPLIEKYSAAGNVEALQAISSVFPDFCLKKLSFNNFVSKAYVASNRQEELLSELEKRYQMKNKLFSIYAFENLLKDPQFEDRVIELAKKYLEVNFEMPLAVVWAHYFKSERYEKAEEISKIRQIAIEHADAMILRHLRQTENINMGFNYVKFVSDMVIKDRFKERAYGTLLDLLVLKQQFDDAVKVLMDAQSKNVALEKHYRSTLVTLKTFLEANNKPVPFTISPEEFHS